MKPIISKLPDLKTSIFSTMNALAREHDAINLAQGFPNFEPDVHLKSLVNKAIQEGYNQYAPMEGIFSLREIIAEKIEALYGAKYHPETEITITAGATQALFTAITTFVRPGDEVIVLKPAYDCYEPAIIANGGIPILVQLRDPLYEVDWDVFRSCITEKTKMVIINTPHNPSGGILRREDLKELEKSLRDSNIIVLSDEVYEHIVFDGQKHFSMSGDKDLASRSMVCASFGKTFHSTGWKMGYCAAPDTLMKEFRKIHEFNVFCVNHPIQRALATYLIKQEHYLDLNSFYQAKRDLFLEGIAGSRFRFTPSRGTYFQLLDYSDISEESDIELSRRLTIERGLASIPISIFNCSGMDHKQLRFCFAKTTDTLKKAVDILQTV